MRYQEELLTNDWKIVRKEILERDHYTCKKCGNEKIKEYCTKMEAKVSFGPNLILLQFEYGGQTFQQDFNFSFPAYKFSSKRFIVYVQEINSKPNIVAIELYPPDYTIEKNNIEAELHNLSHKLSNDIFEQLRETPQKIYTLQERLEKIRTLECEQPSWHTVLCLQVHHKRYIKNRKAWCHPKEILETLCVYCHTDFHLTNPVEEIDEQENVLRMIGPWNEINVLYDYFDIEPLDPAGQ